MISTALALALLTAGNDDPATDARTLFALWDRYYSMFRDVTFLYEGTGAKPVVGAGDPVINSRFQGLYAFRHDGATLLDVFSLNRREKPETRYICSILKSQLEMLNASPDLMSRIHDRVPSASPGGPGSLDRPDAPERIFLAWYFRSLDDPAERELETNGWEAIDGRRCLRVRMLRHPRSSLKNWIGGLPFVKLWIDLQRDGYPLRLEFYRGENLELRTEIVRMVQLPLPAGGDIWFPAEGRTATFRDFRDGEWTYQDEPHYVETHYVVRNTVKFDQDLSDNFFSVKKQALVSSDEGLRRLQRELDEKPRPAVKGLPSDPVSRKKRLDQALAEADRQAQRLEASSAAQVGAGWFEVLTRGLGVLGFILVGGAGFRYWRTR